MMRGLHSLKVAPNILRVIYMVVSAIMVVVYVILFLFIRDIVFPHPNGTLRLWGILFSGVFWVGPATAPLLFLLVPYILFSGQYNLKANYDHHRSGPCKYPVLTVQI
ncbi:hypothetical protein BDN72DRAFT_333601 [Pluteus cervinus]|uniref:Uncharacterized protein n=1 Tax=Pluteus cervinus TaxID=181527 RepID=A0ACD3ABP8_9AGAR|nr:hypothetical protein BDN72DRAFT_333601 [Pluteus cervinus]